MERECKERTTLRGDEQTGGVRGNEAQEERVHVHLERRDGTHHAQVEHHEEAVTGQAIQPPTGKATRCQQVAMHVEVGQAARVGIKLVLHLEGAKVT